MGKYKGKAANGISTGLFQALKIVMAFEEIEPLLAGFAAPVVLTLIALTGQISAHLVHLPQRCSRDYSLRPVELQSAPKSVSTSAMVRRYQQAVLADPSQAGDMGNHLMGNRRESILLVCPVCCRYRRVRWPAPLRKVEITEATVFSRSFKMS